MIPAIFAVIAMCAPAGYLTGSVFVDMHFTDEEGDADDLAAFIPWACAAMPPVAGIVAVVCLLRAANR
jgi:hypothetical protein